MNMEMLQILWYIVLAASLMFYTVLDGFDLGVGSLHLFAKGDQNRRIFLNSIGPFWDGNEVWLVIILGGLFAGFPPVYASVLSGFYILMMFFIFCLMFRASAIEFRSKRESKLWRASWDAVFSIMSICLAFIYGLLLGNFILGVPLDSEGIYSAGFFALFHPYPVLVGFTGLTLLASHGAVFLLMKTEGDIHDKIRNWIKPCTILFLIFYILTSVATIYFIPHMTLKMREYPILFIFPALTLLFILNVPYQVYKNRDGWAFISSCLSIVFLFIVFGLGTFPVLVLSTLDPSFSLTVFNSSSSEKTLGILMIIVVIGLPFVLAYGYWLYYIFRGKVEVDHMSY